MKGLIQMWALIATFIFCVLLLPQIMFSSIVYKDCNQIASLVVEIIEVNEGLSTNAQLRIDNFMEKNKSFSIILERNEISDTYYSYTVVCTKSYFTSIINKEFEMQAFKTTKRVMR